MALARDRRPSRGDTLNRQAELLLVSRALEGSSEAFLALMQPHLDMFAVGIYRIIQDHKGAQDVLEDAMLSIRQSLPSFSRNTLFGIWAYRICIDKALKLRRTRMRNGLNLDAALFLEAPVFGWEALGKLG